MHIYRYFSAIVIAILTSYAYGSTIHVIGDSHAFFCFNNTQSGITADEVSRFHYVKQGIDILVPFHIHWFGSRTMYRVGRDGEPGLNIQRLGVREGDVAVFLFGEIDVRCHIGRQRDEKGRSCSEIIETLVCNYLKTISDNRNKYANLTCVVVSVTPPCDRGFNITYPFYGPLAERVAITQELNHCLKKYSQQRDIYFLDAYSMFADTDGSLGVGVSDGIIHINPKYNAPIKEKLVESLLDKKLL